MIPKYLWSYWDNPIIPPHVQLCIDTWKKHIGSNFKIIILNKQTVHTWLREDVDFPKNIWSLSPVKHSDMFGVALLKKYGGIWLDATILMTGSIDWMLEYDTWFAYNHNNEAELFAFASEPDGFIVSIIFQHLFDIFSLPPDIRKRELCDKYNITDEYLYPQFIVNYITHNNAEFRKKILKNSKPTWDTIYKLVVVLSQRYGCIQKHMLVSLLNTIEDDIPDELLKEPLHKLQGANAQQVKDMILNERSWWGKLTNPSA